jgi:hypothetical protein
MGFKDALFNNPNEVSSQSYEEAKDVTFFPVTISSA